MARCWTTLILFVVLPCVTAAAQPAELRPGLQTYEVRKLLGAPDHVTEQEAHHRQVWRYKQAEITFHDGKVMKIKSFVTPVAVPETEKTNTSADPLAGSDTRDLVREIASEIPSGPDLPAPPDAPPGANPVQPIQPIPNNPPPIYNQAGGQGFAVVPIEPLDEEDMEE